MNRKALFCAAAVALSLLLFSVQAFAMPPCPSAVSVNQPDGQAINITLHGDETFNWTENVDGDVILKTDDGYWCYAKYEDGQLYALSQRVGLDKKPNGVADSATMIQAMHDRQTAPSNRKGIKAPSQRAGAVVQPPTGPQPAVVLLVSFSNCTIQNTDAAWSARIFGESTNTLPNGDNNSSVNGFYKEMSGGNFYFLPAKESDRTPNDGIIRVTYPGNHPDFFSQSFDVDSRMVADAALRAADGAINYSEYDTNGDGIITPDELHIIIILAGYEKSIFGLPTPSVWGHSTGLSSNAPRLDGVSVGLSYTEQGEQHAAGKMASIGILAHELGHSLGLPDLYDYTDSSLGVSYHSLMDQGSWAYLPGNQPGSSPTHLDAWCKSLLGFGTVQTFSSGQITLNSIKTGAYNILKIPTSDPKQYFLLENREFFGYDTSLRTYCKSGGIAIWHIDETVLDNCEYWYGINNSPLHKAIDLEEASEGTLGYSQLDSTRYTSPPYIYDHYYYSGGQTQFSSSTTPSSNLYSGAASGVALSILSAPGNSMVVGLNLSPSTLTISSLTAPASPQLAGRTIRWTCAATGAASILYSFDVYKDNLRVGGSPTINGVATFSASNTFDWKPKVSGTYRVRVAVQTDGSAPVYASSPLYTIQANSNRPVILANGGKLASGSVTKYSVTITSRDADKNDMVHATVTKDGKGATALPANGIFTAEGLYRVTATDLVGNSAVFSFTIDKSKPVISAADPSKTRIAPAGITRRPVKITITDRALSSRSATKNGKAITWPSSGTFSSFGDYVVTARDKVGYVTTFRFTIDYTPPTLKAKLGNGQAVKNGKTVSGAVTVSFSDKHLLTVFAMKNGVAYSWPSGSKFKAVGKYQITAVDKAGNRTVLTFVIKATAVARAVHKSAAEAAPVKLISRYRPVA